MLPHPPAYYGNDWWCLGTLGFWHTELGRVEKGLELNLRSVEANPRNGNAAHGLAHAWYELGDDGAGTTFLERFLSNCPRDAGMHCHVSWHLALFELRSGHPERMWAVYNDAIAPGACRLAPPLNAATDAASMLWGAALNGERVTGEQWREVRAYVLEKFPSTGIPFVDVHRAISCAASGDSATLESIVSVMRDADARGQLPTGPVTPDVIEGLAAFAAGDDATTIGRLTPRLDSPVSVRADRCEARRAPARRRPR